MYVFFCLSEPARVEPGLSEAQIQDTNNMFDTEIFSSYGFRRDTRRLAKTKKTYMRLPCQFASFLAILLDHRYSISSIRIFSAQQGLDS